MEALEAGLEHGPVALIEQALTNVDNPAGVNTHQIAIEREVESRRARFR
ncbi:MAG: hypothetical protein ACRDKV_11030 [Solirubrobacterales bacterium]